MELPLGFSKSLWHVSLTFVKSSGPANFLEMPTRSITAPGVNFKSAAPGSRGSFGCFGIRPDQSTSITSSGSTKSYRIFLHQEIPFLLSREKYRLQDTGKQIISNLNLKKTIYGSSESYECIHSYMYNRIRHKRLFWLYKLKLYIKLLILESI